jgi:hypothetical protein
VILEEEDGSVVERLDDARNLLGSVLPGYEDATFHQLRFIDPYGDTVFNRPQMEPFLVEWDRIATRPLDVERRRVVDQVARLARRCSEEVHLYLRFRGD